MAGRSVSPYLSIFVDTSAWYALVDRTDNHHADAVAFVDALMEGLITSDFIVDETLTLIQARLGHRAAVDLGIKFWREDIATLVPVTRDIQLRAWEIFQNSPDKGFSFTDCTSFALMEQLGITNAFSFDAHFDQLGRVVRLPR